jgi:hypothetical protein
MESYNYSILAPEIIDSTINSFVLPSDTSILPQPSLSQQNNETVDPEQVEQTARANFLVNLRKQRNALLEATDWTVMPDSPLSQQKKDDYIAYRQALRDLPQTVTYDTLFWPVKPD